MDDDRVYTPEQIVALRKQQFDMAMKGDVRMLIWLGKQYLGQSEHPMFNDDDLVSGFELRVIDSVCKQCGTVTCTDDGDAELKVIK